MECGVASVAPLLHPPNKVLVEYIWSAPSPAGTALKSKTRVLDSCTCLEDVPVISETVGDEPVVLRPRKLFADPFRPADRGFIVLCDAFAAPQVESIADLTSTSLPEASPLTLQPHHSNRRVMCDNTLKRAATSRPVFAVEQEYALQVTDAAASAGPGPSACNTGSKQSSFDTAMTGVSHMSAGTWPHAHLPDPTRPYFIPAHGPAMSTPAQLAAAPVHVGRQFAEQVLQHCLQAGLKITEVSQGTAQETWAFKLAPGEGVAVADDLWVSRHIVSRLAELRGLSASFDASKCGGGPGPGCHFKYSTDETRRAGHGLAEIQQHLIRLQARHPHHLLAYGNVHRPHGAVEFTCAFGHNAAALSVPSSTLLARCGHYVDRRPPGDADPYVVVMALVSTTLGVPLPAVHTPTAPRPVMKAAVTCSGCSWGSQSRGTTMCTEDLLIDELGKLDQPDQPRATAAMMEGHDECDDGCSPDRTPVSSLDGPFLLGSMQQSVHYPPPLPSGMGGYMPAHAASYC